MTSADAISAQERPGPAERIAGFLTSHGITVTPFDGGAQGVDHYLFSRIADASEEEIGVVSYDRKSSSVLSVDPAEMRRRLQIPGFVPDVTGPFAGLLLTNNGDFYAPGFDPVHDALDALER